MPVPRSSPIKRALVALLAVVLSVWAWWPMFVDYPGTATLDGRYFHHQLAIAKAAVTRYHELPLWNPFDCAGIPMWDHPEGITASPIFWLTIPFSTTVTMMIWHIVHAAVGFVGMWLLARRELELGETGAFIACVLWTFASCHTTQYAGAHEALISFYNAPLLLYLWRRAEHDWNAAVGCGLVLAWMAYDGATYPLPHSLLMLGLETLMRLWPAKRGLRVVAAGAVVGVVAFSVGAARILPLMAQLGSHTRAMDYPDADHLTAATFRDMYMMRTSAYLAHLPNQQYVIGEYLTYIGWLGVLLAFLGLMLTASELWWLVLLSFALVLLMAGHFAPWAPWTLLRHVPPFTSMRVSARFRLLLMMPIALWIALATERAPALVSRWFPRWGRSVRAVLVGSALLVAGDAAGLGQELIVPRFQGAPERKELVASPRFYYGGPGLASDTIDQPRQNRASRACRAAWTWHQNAALWDGDVPQAKATDDGAVVDSVSRTHNTFTMEVTATRPSRILLNSAYEESWRSDVGAVVSERDTLAIDVPEGKHRIKARYWPRRFTFGIVLSVLGLLGALGFLLRPPRGSKRAS